jgi:hypothetical protein
MRNHNPANERIKREYFVYLKEAKRQSEASVDAVAAAVARFETTRTKRTSRLSITSRRWRSSRRFRVSKAAQLARR